MSRRSRMKRATPPCMRNRSSARVVRPHMDSIHGAQGSIPGAREHEAPLLARRAFDEHSIVERPPRAAPPPTLTAYEERALRRRTHPALEMLACVIALGTAIAVATGLIGLGAELLFSGSGSGCNVDH